MSENLMVGTHKCSNRGWRENYDKTFKKVSKWNLCETCGTLYEEKLCPKCYHFLGNRKLNEIKIGNINYGNWRKNEIKLQ